ncbi:MAG TPA: type II secretion system protein N [Steroidobacteraceae bacterium]|nr:type II secretion system protein N [Steroidobacteraceae bacterium]
MANRTLAILAAVLFALTVLWRAPASWLISALPRSIQCLQPAGSLWSGACGQVRVAGAALSDVRWQLRPWTVLGGHLDLALQSADVRAPATATLILGFGGHDTLQDLRADMPIDTGFLPLFPSGWSGRLQLALSRLEFKAGRLAAIRGTLTASSLAQIQPAMPFGSFELRFPDTAPADGAIRGELRDVGGPLAVAGTLVIRNGSEYELSGSAAARADANAELAKAVEFLGPADAQGRRPYSLAGSF